MSMEIIKMNSTPMRWQVNFDVTVGGKEYDICMLVDDDGIEWDNLLLYNEKDFSYEHIDSEELPDELVKEMQEWKFEKGVKV